MRNYIKGFTAILIIRLGSKESKQLLVRRLVVHMGLLGLLLTLGLLLGLILNQTFARITKRQVTVVMEIHVSLCMIEGIISQDGKWRKSGTKQRRQERESWLWGEMSWMKGALLTRVRKMMKMLCLLHVSFVGSFCGSCCNQVQGLLLRTLHLKVIVMLLMPTSNFVGSKKRFACHDATESDPCRLLKAFN